MRWLLLKDLQILRRSPLQSAVLVLYPVLIAVLVGFAISRGSEKPRVAFVNEVPQNSRIVVGGQKLPQANVQGRDLASAASEIEKVIAADRPPAAKAISVTLSGQVQTMRDSYAGLFSGMALAVILVYLFLVINFQSWLDPLIVLMAVPVAIGGIMWMLYLTGTHLSVPALMGALMCIGLTTANSILVVTFANQRMAAGDDPRMAAPSPSTFEIASSGNG